MTEKSAGLVVVDTGTANLASMLAALKRLGQSPELTSDPVALAEARLAVLPGVGAFGQAMSRLAALGLEDAIRARIAEGRPLLCVCLGLQVLCTASEESPGIYGICAIDARVRRFADRPGLVVPQLGWNLVAPLADSRLIEPGYAYYANSYRLEAIPEGYTGATSDHGGQFVAALERGPLLACQFHPELSGAYGHELLGRWLARARAC